MRYFSLLWGISVYVLEKGEEILINAMLKAMNVFSDLTSSLSEKELENINKSLLKLNGSVETSVHLKCKQKKE